MKPNALCFYLLLSAMVFYLAPARSQTNLVKRPDGKKFTAAEIDDVIRNLMDKAQVEGLCAGIITDNKPSYVKAYGYKNKPEGQYNDTATCFYAASWAKSLFACIVMQLVDEGKLDLDKPLYTYLPKPLPQYAAYKDLAGDERWKLITARQCLDHTTGFPNWRQLNPLNNQKLEIFFTPGSRYAYSGEGIYLLQLVVESITGEGLEELAQKRIFQPFDMRRTSFLWQPEFESDYAVGHDMRSDTLEKHKRSKTNAAGSMETTIADFTRFVAAVMQGKTMSDRAFQEMVTPQVSIHSLHQFPSLMTDTTTENSEIELSYGLGWGIFKTIYGKAFFKEGHDDGWENYLVCFPEKKYAVLIMCNSSKGESIFKELFENLTGVTIPWKWEGYIPYNYSKKMRRQLAKNK